MKIRCLFTTLFICLTGIALGVEVNVPEIWPDSSFRDWTCMDQAVAVPGTNGLSVSSGTLQMKPDMDSGMSLDPRWSFVADSAASGGRFVGSCFGPGAHTLSFDLNASCSAQMLVELVNDSKFIIYNASLSVLPGGTHVSIPLDLNHFSPDVFATGSFEELLRDVQNLWITFNWNHSENAPLFSIDNVLLSGSGTGYGEWIDEIEELTFEQKLPGADADDDGITNGDEFIVDSEPDRAGLPFQISCKGDTLRWTSSSNCQYTVLRSTNLIEQGFVEIGTVPGTGAEVLYQDSERPDRASYRVRVRRRR
jgi:hypothetical protein